tara:strand:+ start:460 stop:636 length:177 start_codon:yes stop_codon:yes gene_type:complete
MNWIRYKDKKPTLGQLVAVFRDIDSEQMSITKWNEEDERYADRNAITHWCEMDSPNCI